MKKVICGLNLILLLSIFCFAQKQKANPVGSEESETQSGQTKRNGNKNRNGGNSILKAGTNLEAELQKTLDVKNAAVGDAVILKVRKEIKQDGEIIVPKGARLIGRVTEVREQTKNNAVSKLGVIFDRIEAKNLDAPISATIVSITNVSSSAAVEDVFSSGMSGGSNTSGRVSGAGSGGGLLGGATNAVGGVVNTAGSTVGNVTGTAGQTLGGATQTLGRTVNGIQISQTADASVNGAATISAVNKNLRIEKGTTFRLQLVN